MILYINGQSLEKYQLNKNYTYKLDFTTDITIDIIEFDLVSLPEFKPLSNRSLEKSNPVLFAEIYNGRGYKVTEGHAIIQNYDRKSGLSKITVKPKIIELLNQKPVYYQDLIDYKPTEILYNLLIKYDLIEYLDIHSYNRLNMIFENDHVYSGLSVNTSEINNTIFDILNEFKTVFMVYVYLKNNKITFFSDNWNIAPPYILDDKWIINYNEKLDETYIINDWSLDLDNGKQYNNQSISNLGIKSREKYGVYDYSVNPSLFFLSTVSSVSSGYLNYAVSELNDKILMNEFPKKWIEIEIINAIVEEIQLGTMISFNDNNFLITRLSKNDSSSIIEGYQIL